MRHGYHNLTNYRMLHIAKDSPFFEEYAQAKNTESFSCEVPSDWACQLDSTWRYLFPAKVNLPDQGWKIHLSSCPTEAQLLLDVVGGFLVKKRVAFKHLVSYGSFLRLNGKNANRSSSGKFITIYPGSVGDFLALLEELEGLLGNFHGPYVLSDIRYKEAPVFFRYGGFRYLLEEDGKGVSRLAIRRPDGSLTEDQRKPFFVLPDFVSVPFGIKKQVDARINPSDEFELLFAPYSILESLHFSNAGGVYRGVNLKTGCEIVAKEARSYAGYSSFDCDAVLRLRHERSMLIRLQGIEGIPSYYSYKTVCGHEFLVEEYCAGVTLQSWVASNYPFRLGEDDALRYSERALVIARQMLGLLDAVHGAGVALMDVNPKNFIVDKNLAVSLIDFEACSDIDGADSACLGMPGFSPLCKCANKERDEFGLACVLSYLFWPSWSSSFSPRSLYERLPLIDKHFPSSVKDMLEEQLSCMASRIFDSPFGLVPVGSEKIDSCSFAQRLAAGIAKSRRPDDSEGRLYPGDATQFLHGPLGRLDIETGAAGVALVLGRFGLDVSSDVEWITTKLLKSEISLHFHGLLRGTVGIASVFSQLGYCEKAIGLLPLSLPYGPSDDISIRSGIAGTVLSLLQINSDCGCPQVRKLLGESADFLRDSVLKNLEPVSDGAETGNAVGLFDGWSGAALACHELAACFVEQSAEWNRLANVCLEHELSGLDVKPDGSLSVDYSGIDFGYLSEGIAGIGVSLALCNADGYANELKAISSSLKEYVALNGGLFHGLLGKAAALLCIDGEENADVISAMVRNVIGEFCFREQSQDFEGPIWALGNGGSCLSVDYSTGSAGLIGFLLSSVEHPFGWFPVSLH